MAEILIDYWMTLASHITHISLREIWLLNHAAEIEGQGKIFSDLEADYFQIELIRQLLYLFIFIPVFET